MRTRPNIYWYNVDLFKKYNKYSFNFLGLFKYFGVFECLGLIKVARSFVYEFQGKRLKIYYQLWDWGIYRKFCGFGDWCHQT